MAEADKEKLTLDILDKFHSTVAAIFRIAKKLEPDSTEIIRLSRILNIAKQEDPLIIINRSKDKIWLYRQYIINEDEDFFYNNKFSQFIKEDENKEFMYTLIGLIKKRFRALSQDEKDVIWKYSKDLLRYVIEYKKITGDHD
jgi:hypothetical protein